jgi:hypothetical protein
MPNGSRYHRREANIHSIACRTGEESGGYNDLGRRGMDKALRLIVN